MFLEIQSQLVRNQVLSVAKHPTDHLTLCLHSMHDVDSATPNVSVFSFFYEIGCVPFQYQFISINLGP
jgi:hypothetical protein